MADTSTIPDVCPDVLTLAVAGVYGVERALSCVGLGCWDWRDDSELDFEFRRYADGGMFVETTNLDSIAAVLQDGRLRHDWWNSSTTRAVDVEPDLTTVVALYGRIRMLELDLAAARAEHARDISALRGDLLEVNQRAARRYEDVAS
jgi:hypothetical protein